MSGIGGIPFGRGAYGLGTPPVAPAPAGSLLSNPNAASTDGSRRIDPVTRDFVVDGNGRTLGMNNVQQLMYVALRTTKNSSAVVGLGHDLASIDTITDNIDRRVRNVIEAAVVHLTQRKLVELTSVTTTRMHPGALSIKVRWRDLTTGVEQTSEI